MKIVLAQLNPTIGAVGQNKQKVLEQLNAAKSKKIDLIIFPELFLCGYSPEDLLFDTGFVEACERALHEIIPETSNIGIIIGLPRKNEMAHDKPFFNSAALVWNKKLIGFQDKTLLPTYDIFDERRFFAPATEHRVWELCGKKIVVTICEDIWPLSGVDGQQSYPTDLLAQYENKSIDLHVSISASPYSKGKIKLRQKMAASCAKRLNVPLILCNQVGAQDGIIFDGSSLVVSKDGVVLQQCASFTEDVQVVDFSKNAIVYEMSQPEELFSALTLGVKDYFTKQGFIKACLGLSGGIDSALVAAIAAHALGKENVLGCLLPSRFTSNESREDAREVALKLGIKTVEISIEASFQSLLDTLDCMQDTDIVAQNLQARIRGMLLMALSNKEGSLVLNTSNKSELAIGFSTLYGDSCGAMSVIGDLLKHQVYEVARYVQQKYGWIPDRVMNKVPTAELYFNQKDSDTIPEYFILDPIVESYVVEGLAVKQIAQALAVSESLVQEIVVKIHKSEYKRRQCPFALRVSAKAFSCGRRVPIVQKWVENIS